MDSTIGDVRIDGEKLRQLRLERFMDIGELSEKSGMHRDHIGRLERGEWTGGSRPSTVRKLAQALDVDPHELLKED
jgi:transcriptional regulator with XRE-family HTH domain